MTSVTTQNWYPTCPICDGKTLSNLYVVDGFTITHCAQCTLVFVRERMTEETLKPYYENPDQDHVYDDPDNASNLEYFYNRLKEQICKSIQRGKVLDVGCNQGQFLDVLGDDWERYGNELSPHFAQMAKQKYGDHIFQGMLADFPLTGERFDVITMMDVLDHSPDPIQELRRANQLLKPGGLVAIKVHNISCLWARVVKDKFYAIIPPYHLWYFNRATLTRILASAGFKVTSSLYIGNLLQLKTIPYRFSRGKTNNLYYSLFKLLDKSPLGRIPIYKNLHDLITIIAVKESNPSG
jgi:SAM-dependent methyltransferase